MKMFQASLFGQGGNVFGLVLSECVHFILVQSVRLFCPDDTEFSLIERSARFYLAAMSKRSLVTFLSAPL
jgi:hypothetical protein